MLECYFAVSPAAAIAAMAALRVDCAWRLRAVRRRAMRRRAAAAAAAVALAAHDEGDDDAGAAAQSDASFSAVLDATNTAIMVGDQILPSVLRVECGLEVTLFYLPLHFV